MTRSVLGIWTLHLYGRSRQTQSYAHFQFEDMFDSPLLTRYRLALQNHTGVNTLLGYPMVSPFSDDSRVRNRGPAFAEADNTAGPQLDWILRKLHHEAEQGVDGVPAVVRGACYISQVLVPQWQLRTDSPRTPASKCATHIENHITSTFVFLPSLLTPPLTAHHSPSSFLDFPDNCSRPISSFASL